jgi:hypothetical protein
VTKTRGVIILCLALLAGACARSAQGTDAMKVIPLSGGDVFLVDGEDETRIGEAEELTPGDAVRTSAEGRALVQLPDGQGIELAPSSLVRVADEARTELLDGRALLHAPTGVAVSSGPAQIYGSGGDFRVDRYVGALRLGVYTGSATVEGWDGEVRGLQEAGVSAGIVPEAPRPLQVDVNDRWDARFLGQAIDIGQRLAEIVGALTSQLPPGTEPESVIGALPEAFPAQGASRELVGVSPAEGLVAAILAFQAARSDARSAIGILREIIDLRELGGSWVIVVATWQLVQERLEALARLTDRVTQLLVPSVAPPGVGVTSSAGSSSSGGTSSGSAPAGSTGSQTGSSDSGGGGDGGSDGGGGTPEPPSCGSELECTVEDVLGTDGPDLGL